MPYRRASGVTFEDPGRPSLPPRRLSGAGQGAGCMAGQRVPAGRVVSAMETSATVCTRSKRSRTPTSQGAGVGGDASDQTDVITKSARRPLSFYQRRSDITCTASAQQVLKAWANGRVEPAISPRYYASFRTRRPRSNPVRGSAASAGACPWRRRSRSSPPVGSWWRQARRHRPIACRPDHEFEVGIKFV
jgi:hypothetical protein